MSTMLLTQNSNALTHVAEGGGQVTIGLPFPDHTRWVRNVVDPAPTHWMTQHATPGTTPARVFDTS